MKKNKVEVITPEEMKSIKKITRSSVETLTLDDIEQKMVKLATDESADFTQILENERRIAMLEKVANLKMNRIRLAALEQAAANTTPTEVKPLEVHFISSKTEEQRLRLERIDKEIIESKGIKQNA